MEFLGHVFENPSRKKSNGKWNPIEIEYDNSDEFNKATSLVLKTIGYQDSDGKCLIANQHGDKFMLEINFASYDTAFNTIKLFPINCFNIKDN